MSCDRAASSSARVTLGPATSEAEPLLQSHSRARAGTPLEHEDVENVNRSFADDVPNNKRQLGLLSAASLIFNRMIGSGVFATPSIILNSSGSVGIAFVMWILGALVAAAGTAVYVEFGTGLPRSGGEKTYMEYVFRRPAFMTTCVYAVYGVCIGRISASSVAIGEYVLHALAYERTPTNIRIVAFLCSTFCLIVHGAFLKFGLKLQNALGAFKLVVLVLIIGSGFLSLIGVPGFAVGEDYDQPNNYTWQTFWEGSNFGANAFAIGMYNVIWSYTGYSNANYALSEVRDPVRTIKVAAPLAMSFVAFTYVSVNVAYFAVVSKADMLNGGTIPAALFFRNLYGPATERALSAVISLTILGNMLSVLFTQGRVVQELGREDVLPYSSFFASNKPFNAPLPGLFTQYLVSFFLMALAPPGDAYLININYGSYSLSLFNLVISGGLLLLYTDAFKSYNWKPPFRAYKSVVVLFFLSNLFLILVPMIPPAGGYEPYQHLPYYSHVVAALSVGFLGVVYWFIFFRWIPERNGYTLKRVTVIQEDGVPRNVFRRIPKGV
ncbi:APC amino acid permease [Boletus edulis BED1]|uniref:APC amino acid permease n=1 Tax=Boletus edulis BED1 TaxID=1328754 RepID=A0AAD4GET1_BOLED|nr:APC amino acid permease [Boletus edulis BED1]